MTTESQILFQIGREVVRGTPVAAQIKMLGFDMLKDNRTIIQPDGYDSVAGSAGRWVEGRKTSRFLPPERPLTFEEAPIFLSAGLGDVTPTTSASSNRFWNGAVFAPVPSPTTLETSQYLYVGLASKFRGVRFVMSTLNATPATLIAEYSISAGVYGAATIRVDGSRALRNNGILEIVPPSDWDLATEDTLSRYWLRISPSVDLDPVTFTTLDVVPLAVVREWSLPSFAADKIHPATFTFETGASDCAFRSDYCFMDSMLIAMGQVPNWRHMTQWWGRHFEIITPATGLLHVDQHDIVAGLTKFYMNDPFDGPGATERPNTLSEFRLQITSGLVPVFGANGSPTYYAHRWALPTANLSMTLECNAFVKAELALRDTRPPPTRVIRIQGLGTEIVPGTSNEITIDLTGTWSDLASPSPDEFGDLQVAGDMFVQFHPQSSVRLDVRVVNERAALP